MIIVEQGSSRVLQSNWIQSWWHVWCFHGYICRDLY